MKLGLEKLNELSIEKSQLIYDLIDNSGGFYSNNVEKQFRSRMNIPFLIKNDESKELNSQFLKEAEENGLLQLKGHRSVGGMRASIYNGMSLDGVKKLR